MLNKELLYAINTSNLYYIQSNDFIYIKNKILKHCIANNINNIRLLYESIKLNFKTNTLSSIENSSIIISDSLNNLNINELYSIVKEKDLKYFIISEKDLNHHYLFKLKIETFNLDNTKNIIKKFFNNDKNIKISQELITKISNYMQGIIPSKIPEILSYAINKYETQNINILDSIIEEKKEFFKLNLSMEFSDTEKINNLGGLKNLKNWLKVRKKIIYSKNNNIPFPKGILLVGVQGCGKSLTAKSISSLWDLPLLKMDFSLLFTSDKTPEESFKENLNISEKLSPIVLWVDEIDKLFSLDNSSIELKRIMASFLTWLQEKKSKVFVVATANNIENIPPELLRKGRFDEIFFLDLPNHNERKDIFKIHLSKRKLNIDNYNIELLAKKTEFFSGSEIEELIISSLYEAFNENREVLEKDIINMIQETYPFYNTYEEEIKKIRDWALNKARKASSNEELYNMFE